MAVAAPRPTPPAVLRQELQDARARGLTWDQAWRHARAQALQDIRGRPLNVQQWEETIRWSKPFFRAAYLRHGPDPLGRQIYDLG